MANARTLELVKVVAVFVERDETGAIDGEVLDTVSAADWPRVRDGWQEYHAECERQLNAGEGVAPQGA